MSPPVDPSNRLSVLTTRELLANRALARKRGGRGGRGGGRGRRAGEGAKAMVARIDAELERRRQQRGAFLVQSVPAVAALDETGTNRNAVS